MPSDFELPSIEEIVIGLEEDIKDLPGFPAGTPFSRLANAQLLFEPMLIPAMDEEGNPRLDPTTGNIILERKSLLVLASLTVENKQPANDMTPGMTMQRIPLKGRTVSPRYLPASVKPGSKAKITLTDPVSGNAQTGDFVISNTIQSRVSAITKSVGSRISGYWLQPY